MKYEEFANNSPTDFAEECFIRKLHILQTTLARDDAAIFAWLFVFLNISNFMHIFKPQWRYKTSIEVHYLNPGLSRACCTWLVSNFFFLGSQKKV